MNPIPLSSSATPTTMLKSVLLGHEGRVQRGRERGLRHPDVAGAVRDRLALAAIPPYANHFLISCSLRRP
jgi:hypothetical protein